MAFKHRTRIHREEGMYEIAGGFIVHFLVEKGLNAWQKDMKISKSKNLKKRASEEVVYSNYTK